MSEPSRAATLASRFFASIGAASAIIVAVCSLGITIYEARITREHQKLSVWPRLSLVISDSAGIFTRTVVNHGLGPALVRSYQMTVDKKPMASWTELLDDAAARRARCAVHLLLVRARVGALAGRAAQRAHGRERLDPHDPAARRAARGGHGVLLLAVQRVWIARSGETDPAPVDACDETSTHELAL